MDLYFSSVDMCGVSDGRGSWNPCLVQEVTGYVEDM